MNLFKTLAMVGLVGVEMVTKGLCADSEDADLKMWQEKAAAIKTGTPLAEVKKILGLDTNAALYAAYCSGPHCAGLLLVQSNITACVNWQGGPDFPNDPVNQVSIRSGPVFPLGTRPTGSGRVINAVTGNSVEIQYLPPSEQDAVRRTPAGKNTPSPTPQ